MTTRDYLFPDPALAGMSSAELHEVIAGWLPSALKQCDGTDPNCSVRSDYAQDIIEQSRDLLVDRGHVFTADQVDELDFLPWPLTPEQQQEVEARQAAEIDHRKRWLARQSALSVSLCRLIAGDTSGSDIPPSVELRVSFPDGRAHTFSGSHVWRGRLDELAASANAGASIEAVDVAPNQGFHLYVWVSLTSQFRSYFNKQARPMHTPFRTLHEIREEPGFFPRAVFRLQTADGREVFMKVSRTKGLNEKRFIVEVDAERFLTLWRRDPWAPPAVHGHEDWTEDRKYDGAVAGFAWGRRDPVPLACVAAHERPTAAAAHPSAWQGLIHLFNPRRKAQGEQTHVVATFTNGNTRTLWLMANGVATFPVECEDRATADRLQLHAGVGSPTLTVDQLLPLSDLEPDISLPSP